MRFFFLIGWARPKLGIAKAMPNKDKPPAMRGAIDYTGVCLLVSKAFEVEISKRFFRDYIAYLAEHYPWNKSKKFFTKSGFSSIIFLLKRY